MATSTYKVEAATTFCGMWDKSGLYPTLKAKLAEVIHCTPLGAVILTPGVNLILRPTSHTVGAARTRLPYNGHEVFVMHTICRFACHGPTVSY